VLYAHEVPPRSAQEQADLAAPECLRRSEVAGPRPYADPFDCKAVEATPKPGRAGCGGLDGAVDGAAGALRARRGGA